MELRGVWVLLAVAVSSALTKNTELYAKLGGEVTLRPAPVSAPVTSVLWKHNEDQVAEWINEKLNLEFNGILRGHADMTKKDGVLRIFNMTEAHQGLYTVEINSDLQPDGFQVKVLKELRKPEVVLRPLTCSQSSESCTLKCHGDTSGAEPVTYFWKRDDGEWQQNTAETIIINKEEAPRPQTYACRMQNPISVSDSEPFNDPFIHPPSSDSVALPVGLTLLGVGLAVAGGLLYGFRHKEPVHGLLVQSGIMKRKEDGAPAPANQPMLPRPNGTPAPEGPKEGQPGSKGPEEGQPGSKGPEEGQPGSKGPEEGSGDPEQPC